MITAQSISKRYNQQTIFEDIDLRINKSSITAIVGKSGSGKSTLLHVIAGLEHADGGSIEIDGQRISSLKETELATFRLSTIGLVFQFFNFLPTLSLQENICIPGYLAGLSKQQMESAAEILSARVGLNHSVRRQLPHEVSGGELQRAAIVRALLLDPPLILADEPTGNLDEKHSEDVLELFLQLVRENNKTLIMVTHDLDIASHCDDIFTMTEGKLNHDSQPASA